MKPKSISSVILHYPSSKPPAVMEIERMRAIEDLCQDGAMSLVKDVTPPPYRLDLSIENKQLLLAISQENGTKLQDLILSLSPYRSIIRDYFMMIESYERMRSEGHQSKLEPIDMARRGLHDEAATMMMERLKDKLEIDHATARKLFTLVCALHMDQARLWTPG